MAKMFASNISMAKMFASNISMAKMFASNISMAKMFASNVTLLANILAILAGDQWWPRTSGGRLRCAHAITHLLRHRFGLFIKGNKRNTHKERLTKFSA